MCAFCGKLGNRAREHVIPRWFSHQINQERRDRFVVEQDQPQREWKTKEVNIFASTICENCNSGWMSRIENEAKLPMSRMISGDKTLPCRDDLRNLSKWFTKTAFVADLNALDVAGKCFFGQIEREEFMLNQSCSNRISCQIWIASYQGSRTVSVLPQHLSFFNQSKQLSSTGYCLTLSLGRLAAQVLMYRVEPDACQVEAVVLPLTPAAWSAATILVHPQSNEIDWPPPQVFDDAGLLAFHDRFCVLPPE